MMRNIKKVIKSLVFGKKKTLPIKESQIDRLKRKGLKVGTNFNLLAGCIIDESHSWLISIGNNVTLAPNVHVLAHDASTYMHLGYTKLKKVTIGNKVFIGANSVVMPGVTIGDNVIIGAGSVVTKDVPNDSIYAGQPAKYLTSTSKYIENQKKLMNESNVFDQTFTERMKITKEQKEVMIKNIDTYGVAYVM